MTTKKQLVARGIAGALSLCGVLGMVGCGADVGEQGAAGEGEIGVASEALNTVGTTTSLANSAVRDYAASCAIRLSGKDYLLVAGGRTALTPTVSNQWHLYDAQTDAIVNSGTFDTGRYAASMIQVPGATNKCVMAGGYDASNAAITSDTTIVFTIAAGTPPTISTSKPTGFQARGEFTLAKCGSSSVVAIGGGTVSSLDASGSTVLGTNTIQRWNDGANWTNVSAGLATPRMNHGLASTGSDLKFVAAGGETASVVATDNIEAFSFSQSQGGVECDTKTAVVASSGVATTKLSPARNKTVAFKIFEETVSSQLRTKFVVPGGSDAAATPAVTNTSDVVIVNWNAPSITVENGPNLVSNSGAALRLPTLVIAASGTPVLIGGENASNQGLDSLQKWDLTVTASPYTNGFVDSSGPADLAVARGASAAAYLPSETTAGRADVSIFGGHNATPALVGSLEDIVTP